MKALPIFLGGEDRVLSKHYSVINPATEEVIATVSDAGYQEAIEAITIAENSFSEWRKTPAVQRADILMAAYHGMLAEASGIAKTITSENGKPLKEAEQEVLFSAGYLRWFAEEARRANGDTLSSPRPGRRFMTTKELNKNDLLTVVGEMGDFYAVEAPAGTKAFVFRSYVLDGIVEANRVNIRLSPDLESPVLGQLKQGDKVQTLNSVANNKWYEIETPSKIHFYVAKDYLQNIGGPEVKSQVDKRNHSAASLIASANQLSSTELRKNFSAIDIDRVINAYTVVINDYADFPEYVEQAKEAMVTAQEAYLQKKVEFARSGSSLSSLDEIALALGETHHDSATPAGSVTDKMKLWQPIEEAVYMSWATINEGRDKESFYEEQQVAAVPVTGILEAYTSPVKNKPGDFIVKDKDIPVAYLYSTQINLQNYVGQKVTAVGAPRPNNNFAFPAFYVFSVE